MASAGEEIDGLYELPLEEFTAARNELAKRLRADGEKDAAAEVAKLGKPSRPAWAINRAARSEPGLAQALFDAAAGLAEAQEAVVSGSGRELLDEAVAAEREAVEGLVAAARAELEAAGSASQGMVDRARKTLHAVAGDPELQDELASARIAADREPVGFGAAVPPTTRRRASTAKRSGGGKAAAAKETGTATREAEDEAVRASRKQLADARRRVEQAERRLGKRERDLKRSQERLDQARASVVAAEEEVAEVAEDLQRRRKELEDARAVLEELS